MSTQVAPGVRLYSRAEVGLPDDVGGSAGAAQDVLRVHHAASANGSGFAWCRSKVLAFNRLHRINNDWSDIGYSFLIGRSDDPDEAYIFTGRGWGQHGAHTSGHNEDLGVCFIGNAATADVLTPGVKRAYDWLRSARHDGPRSAFGHRDTSQTACPGDALYAWVRAGMPVTTREGDDMTPEEIAHAVWTAREIPNLGTDAEYRRPRAVLADLENSQERFHVELRGLIGEVKALAERPATDPEQIAAVVAAELNRALAGLKITLVNPAGDNA